MKDTGERQVAPTIDGIRRDHVARYEWAASLLSGQRVVDVACGIGYGTNLLAQAGCLAQGVDRDAEALQYGAQHYAHERLGFTVADVSEGVEPMDADAVVCFEAVEHIEDPAPMLRSLRNVGKRLLVSVPNERVFPWRNYAYHYRHYTKQQLTTLLHVTGWVPVAWYGQEGPESDVAPDVEGHTLIAECVPAPKHVAIVGLGPSVDAYVDAAKRMGGRHAFCDHVWSINALGNVLDSDIVFHMDDVRIQESRAEAKPESNIANMVQWLREYRGTVITSREHPSYPGLVEFPLEHALNTLGHGYFNNTAAYAVAYAIMMGVEKISLFGCDYTYPNAHDAEKGRACLEFWLGYARAKGIKILLPKTTSLMDALSTNEERLYGYDTVDVDMRWNDKRTALVVDFKERAKVATAEEIEARYDHSAHPNPLVKEASGNG